MPLGFILFRFYGKQTNTNYPFVECLVARGFNLWLVGKDLQVEPQKAEEPIVDNYASGLTYKQQLKQDAMLWAEFLYAEYKREKALLEEAQVKPTHYDNKDT